jgi:hypothetical protein
VHAALADPLPDDGGALESEEDVDVDEEEGEDGDGEDELLSPLEEPLLQAPPMSAAVRQATTTPTARVPRIRVFSIH